MRVTGKRVQVDYTPLEVTGVINIIGGSAVQFYDGNNFYPNREGSPASPILLKHNVTAVDVDDENATFDYSTLFYEDNVLINAETQGYTVTGNTLKVQKNIAPGTSVEIKAISKLIYKRTSEVYEQIDKVLLRTIIKTEAPYQLTLTPRGAQIFDAYRNPNTTASIVATLKKGDEEVSYTGITFKWLNAAGADIMENELYGHAVSANKRTLTIDKTYIDKEIIKCEAWKGSELLASDTVSFVREFNSFNPDVRIPELPLLPGISTLSCTMLATDFVGNIDVDKAFAVTWMVEENTSEREIAHGASAVIPVSAINLNAPNLTIYPDVKRREAYAALVDETGALLTDENGNILTIETFGI